MSGVNFSASGTRWRAVPIATTTVAQSHDPPLPGTGLFFTSADGEARFLALAPDAVPSLAALQSKTSAELGGLVDAAPSFAR